MSLTRTFEEYIDYLENLKRTDPLFLFNSPGVKVDGAGSEFPLVADNNSLYLLNDNPSELVDIVRSIGFTVQNYSEPVVDERSHDRGAKPPRVRRVLTCHDAELALRITFEHGAGAVSYKLHYPVSGEGYDDRSFVWRFHHYTTHSPFIWVQDGSFDINTNAIVTGYSASSEFRKRLHKDLDGYDLDAVITFQREKLTLREFIDDYGLIHNFNTRASVEFNIKFMRVLVARKITGIYQQANNSGIYAANGVKFKY